VLGIGETANGISLLYGHAFWGERTGDPGKSCNRITCERLNVNAVSIALASSRTLPGHEYRRMASIASSSTPVAGAARMPRVEKFDEVLDQERNILKALSQRRYLNDARLKTVVEILSKPSRLHRLLRIAVGRGNQAYVHCNLHDRSYWTHRALLDCAQQLALRIGTHLRDFIHRVPRSAARNSPKYSAFAPVNAPRLYPNSSLSIRFRCRRAR